MKNKTPRTINYLKVTSFLSLGWVCLILTEAFDNGNIEDDDEDTNKRMIVEGDGLITLEASILGSKLIQSPTYSSKI